MKLTFTVKLPNVDGKQVVELDVREPSSMRFVKIDGEGNINPLSLIDEPNKSSIMAHYGVHCTHGQYWTGCMIMWLLRRCVLPTGKTAIEESKLFLLEHPWLDFTIAHSSYINVKMGR